MQSSVANAKESIGILEVKPMDFWQRKLYHQIHPLKLATDIGVTPISLYFLWEHRIAPVIVIGFVPPVVVSVTTMIWPPDLERLKRSVLGQYISKYMTRTVEVIRFLSLVPMAWGGVDPQLLDDSPGVSNSSAGLVQWRYRSAP